MKNSTLQLLLLVIIVLVFQPSWAQAPQKMSYQAVIRNSSDKLVVNQKVGMQISILKGSETGTVVYTETQKPTTNINGLVSLEIGTGTSSDDFSAIDWANGPYYIKTATDPTGGTTYTINGVSQLLSVPYALYARNVENDKVNDADADPTNEIQALSISGTSLTLSKGGGTVTLPSSGGGDNWGTQTAAVDATLSGNGTTATPLKIAQQSATSGQILKWNGTTWKPANESDNDPTNEIQILSKSGNTVTLSNGGGSFIDAVDDADSDPTNEIQALSISGTSLTLSKGGGTVSLPAGADNWGTQTVVTNATLEGNGTTGTPLKIAQQGATTGQALKWNGSVWLPGSDIANGSVAGGDLGGTYPNPAVTKIQGVDVSNSAPTTGQVLTYNGSSWAPTTTSTGLTLPFANSSSYSSTAFSVENTGAAWYTIAGYSDNNYGIFGKTKGYNAAGVYGTATGGDISIGVLGTTGEGIFTTTPGNSGVTGFANEHIGVTGTAVSGTGGYFTSKTGSALYTKGKIQMTGISEADDRVLTCDATGFATWQDPEWQKSGNNVYYNSGHVGIGISAGTTMYSLLELNGNAYQSDIHIYNDDTGTTNFDGLKVGYGSYGYLWNYENSDLIFGTNSLERLTIKANGNIGMGTSMPNYKLDIAGNLNLNRGVASGVALSVYGAEALWFNGTYFSWGYGGTWNFFGDKVYIGATPADPGANMLVVNGAAAKPGGGSWSTWSDIRLKDIHGDYKKGLKEIISLQPVNFSYKVGNPCNLSSAQNYVGFIAQEVQKVFPEAVSQGKDGYLTLDVNSINVALVNAIKELKAENDKLKDESNKQKIESDQLKAENELLKSKNDQIDARLTNLEKIIRVSAMK